MHEQLDYCLHHEHARIQIEQLARSAIVYVIACPILTSFYTERY